MYIFQDSVIRFRYLIISILCITYCQALAVPTSSLSPVDSILLLITPDLTDQQKATYYNEAGMMSENVDTSTLYFETALTFCSPTDTGNIARAYQNIGANHYMKHNPSQALPYLEKAVDLYAQMGKSAQNILINITMAQCYEVMNMPGSVFEHLNKALEIGIETKDTAQISYTYLELGRVNINMTFYNTAEEYLKKAMRLDSLSGAHLDMAADYFWIGYLSIQSKKYNKATIYLTHAIKTLEKRTPLNRYYNSILHLAYVYLADTYINIATKNNDKQFTDSCLYYLNKNDNFFLSAGMYQNHMLDRYTYIKYLSFYKKYKEALNILLSCEQYQNGKDLQRDYQLHLSEIYEKLGDYRKAYEHHQQLLEYTIEYINDSTLTAAADAKTGEAMVNERLKQKQMMMVHAAEKSRMIVIIVSLTFGLVMVSLLVAVVLIMLKNKRKANDELSHKNKILDEQREEIETQNDRLAEQNKIINQAYQEITDSIDYAQRIQNSILPDLNSIINTDLAGAFTIFRPLKVVSGDFYWARRHQNGKLIFVCADCTGHGVPGALMSMIGSALLNDICSSPTLIPPSNILTLLDAQLQNVIGQNKELYIQDSIDLVILIIDPVTLNLTYSTARRPFYIWRNGVLTEYKGTKHSIGDKEKYYRNIAFRTSTIQLMRNDIIYLFTDGFTDLFGGQEEYGEHGTRLQTTGLTNILEHIAPLSIEQQAAHIESAIDKWQGTCPQTDDMTMIGIKI